MFRRLLLATLITISTVPAYADCQSFKDAWSVSEKIAARGAELKQINEKRVSSFFAHLRKNGVEIPIDWRPESAIILRAQTVTILAPVINGQVCHSVFIPTPVWDAYFGRDA